MQNSPRNLFVFGFETPTEFLNNAENGWDDESSLCFWIEAHEREQALDWGQEVARRFVDWLFESNGSTGYEWSRARYANWIEVDAKRLATANSRDGILSVKVGELPDFSKLLPAGFRI